MKNNQLLLEDLLEMYQSYLKKCEFSDATIFECLRITEKKGLLVCHGVTAAPNLTKNLFNQYFQSTIKTGLRRTLHVHHPHF